jgi:hypothetical protein
LYGQICNQDLILVKVLAGKCHVQALPLPDFRIDIEATAVIDWPRPRPLSASF